MSGLTPANSRSEAHANSQLPAVLQAKQALAKANAAVDADKAAHSPCCVAIDQKQVARAEVRLSQVSAVPSSTARALSITV